MGKKILLADDSITIQKVIELTFSDEDFDVVTVGNGRLALEKLADVRPDIVLCDIIMPEKDGIETIMDMKRLNPALRVIAISGGGRSEPEDYLHSARLLGADQTVKKPFTNEDILRAVRSLLA